MRKQITFKIEVGDANYVKPGEYFGVLSADGTTITSIQRRGDDLSLEPIVEHLELENNKAVTATSASVVVTPSSGKDAMKKVTVTIPLEEGTATKSIASLTAGDTLVLEPAEGKLGLSTATITFTE